MEILKQIRESNIESQKTQEKKNKEILQKFKNFDYKQLSERELSLLESLSKMNMYNGFISLLKNELGSTQTRENYVDANKIMLNTEKMVQYNESIRNYKQSTITPVIGITGFSTLGALIYGVIVLPARKSPVKYTLIGLGVGSVVSYALWRVQLYKYNQQINSLFRNILLQQYQQLPGNQQHQQLPGNQQYQQLTTQ